MVGFEKCDDYNKNSGDGCSNDCKKVEKGYVCHTTENPTGCNAYCGDGYIVPGKEICDDGNMNSGDGCSKDCRTFEPGFVC